MQFSEANFSAITVQKQRWHSLIFIETDPRWASEHLKWNKSKHKHVKYKKKQVIKKRMRERTLKSPEKKTWNGEEISHYDMEEVTGPIEFRNELSQLMNIHNPQELNLDGVQPISWHLSQGSWATDLDYGFDKSREASHLWVKLSKMASSWDTNGGRKYSRWHSSDVIENKISFGVELNVQIRAFRMSGPIHVPLFQAEESHWILLQSHFVDKHLLGTHQAREVADPKVANEANPLTMTRFGVFLVPPDFQACVEPFQIRISWRQEQWKIIGSASQRGNAKNWMHQDLYECKYAYGMW